MFIASKKKWIFITIAVLLAIGGLVFGYVFRGQKNQESIYQTEPARRGDLTQTVTATGVVKSLSDVELSFETGGRIQSIEVKESQRVKKDDVLIRLASEELELTVREKQSAYQLALANLNQKLAGSSDETIEVAKKEVSQAEAALKKAEDDLRSSEVDLENTKKTNSESIRSSELSVESANDSLSFAKTDLENVLEENQKSLDHAYENATIEMEGDLVTVSSVLRDMDGILGIDETTANNSFEYLLGVSNQQSKTDAITSYTAARDDYKNSKKRVEEITENISQDEKDDILLAVKQTLTFSSKALLAVRSLLDNTVVGTGLSQTSLDTYRSTIDTDRTSVNTQLADLETKEQAITSARLNAETEEDSYRSKVQTAENSLQSVEQSLEQAKAAVATKQSQAGAAAETAKNGVLSANEALETAKAKLALTQASPREVDVASLRAAVSQAQAALGIALNNLEKTALKTPIDGVVGKIFFDVGEEISAHAKAVSLFSDLQYVVEADIAESDIALVAVGQKTEVTLDAFGDDTVFPGAVLTIDVEATIIEKVIYYKVEAAMETGEKAIKPDMTANITIFTDSRQNVIYIPQRAVFQRDGEKHVRILKLDGMVEERDITSGMSGDDGLVEILSGLSENEPVIVFDKSEKKVKF